MTSPLIDRLVDELGYPVLDDDNFEDFITNTPYSVLFLTEDPKRFPESLDVAVILPELIKRFGQLTPAVVSTNIQTACRGRYNFMAWPALVFLKNGQYLDAITKVQNWDDYVREISRILTLAPRPDPGIGIPVVFNPISKPCGQ